MQIKTTTKNSHKETYMFAKLIVEKQQREKGIKPAHYTKKGHCKRCGDVWIFENAPSRFEGCPWCINRKTGKPIPRPYKVKCLDCKYFIVNQHSMAGIGDCKLSVNNNACFGFRKRDCKYFKDNEK